MAGTAPTPKPPVRLFTKDAGRRRLVTIPARAGSAILRFQQLQGWMIHPGTQLDPGARAIAMLIGLEGIVRAQDLPLAYSALAGTFEFQKRALIEWQLNGHTDRRELSVYSRLNLTKVQRLPDFESALMQLLNAAEKALLCPSGSRDLRLDALLNDAQANASVALPTALFAHLMGEAKFTPLPRSCLARAESGMALKMPTHAIPQPDKSDRVFERSLEAALLGQKGSAIRDMSFCMSIRQALTAPQRGTVATRRALISQQLLDLGPKCEQVSLAANLLMAFAIELHERGTQGHGRLDVDSPNAYFNAIFKGFLDQFSDVHLMSLKPEDYAKRIAAVSVACPDSKARAALSAFHHFLRTWDLAPSLPKGLFGDAPETQVKANRLWPHEIDRIHYWLEEAAQTRLIEAVRCAFAIGSSVPVRIGELLWQRLEGIRLGDNFVEFDLSPLLCDPSLKSPESRRRPLVTNPMCVAIIRSWVQRRRDEQRDLAALRGEPVGDLVRGYLFGDPNNAGKLFRLGAMSLLLNRLLKAVTGDLSIAFHILRHTLASPYVEGILIQSGSVAVASDVNPIDVWGSTMGHSSGQTVLEAYAHEFEAALRVHLDAALFDHFQPKSNVVEFWTKEHASTVRQRTCRAPANERNLVGNRCLQSAAVKMHLPKADTGFELSVSCIPLTPLAFEDLTVCTVAAVLFDLGRGISMAQTRMRQDLSLEQVENIAAVVGCLSDRLTGRRTRSQSDVAMGIEALVDPSDEKLGFRPDFQRMQQPRWPALLSSMNSATDSETLKAAIDYWVANVHGIHLALVPSAGLQALLSVIDASKLNLQLMRIHVNGKLAQLSQSQKNDLLRIESFVEGCLGQPLTPDHMSARRGQRGRHVRPMFYLVVGSAVQKKLDASRLGAAQSIAGLNCTFLAAYVALQIKKESA